MNERTIDPRRDPRDASPLSRDRRERSLRSRLIGALTVGSALVATPVPAADVPQPVLDAQRARVETIERIAPAVVAIFGPQGGGGGSGVLISPGGYALTNYHVTSGSGDWMKCGLPDGKLYDAVIVGTDPTGDVALVRLLGRDDFPTATLGDSDAVDIGDWVLALGNPFLLAKADFQPTVTYGVVSGTHRYQEPAGTFLEYTDCLQVDASINPGNSGGPLFNEAGELIGINGRISIKRGRVNSGAGYAISINQIGHFLGHLRSGRIVDHGTLGAAVRTNFDGAVEVTEVLESSDAHRRGLREGDEIVEFAGRPVRSTNQFKNVLGIYPAGRMLPLTYRRDGETAEIRVRLGALNRRSDLLATDGGQENPLAKPPPPPPEGVAKLIEKRPGFANAHANAVETERVLDSLRRPGPADAVAGPWRLTGTDPDGTAFELTLADPVAGLEIGRNVSVQKLDADRPPVDEPPGSGGLLFALHHWRLLVSGRTDGFAEFYYVGREPLDGVGETVDILHAEDRGAVTRFYVLPDGRLAGLDTRIDPAADFAAVRFAEPRSFDGLTFPSEIAASLGPDPFRTLRVETARVGEVQEKP